MKLGAAYRWNEKLLTTLDINQPNDNYMFVSVGSEYNLLRFMALRMGYRYRLNGLELGDLSGLSAGIGFVFPFTDSMMRFDYAFMPYGVLGNSHRVSIGIEFGHPAAALAPVAVVEKKKQKTPAASAGPAPLPPVQRATPVAAPLEGYSVYKAVVVSRLKLANARSAVYKVTAQSNESLLTKIDGEMRIRSGDDLTVNIGEKSGAPGSKAYRSFAFSTNSPAPYTRVTINLKLPKELKNPSIKLAAGNKAAKPVKISEDGDSIVYEIKMDSLQEFSVINE